MLIAGLWYDWHRGDQSMPTFTLNTTAPNAVLQSIPHDRMVCVLDPSEVAAWIDPENEAADELLKPCPDEWLTYYVGTIFANDWRNQGPKCIEKGPPGSELPPPPEGCQETSISAAGGRVGDGRLALRCRGEANRPPPLSWHSEQET